MHRITLFLLLSLGFTVAQAHHWVVDVYDGSRRFVAEVKVKQFKLVNPHPLLLIEISSLPSNEEVEGIEVGQTWALEMDNLRELVELGFNKQTFVAGDNITVAVDPSFNDTYRKNTLYLRAAEHQRQGFVYVHNVRQLFPVDPEGNSLSKYLQEVR